MPVVTKWIESNKRFVRKNGFVWMDKKQRKRRLPEAKNPQAERWQRSRAERQATNAIVQGSSAIQTKVSMNAIYRWCMEKQAQGHDFKMWCVVHDESLILAPDDVTREEVREYERLMLESYKFGDIPLKTDVEMMYRWGQSVTVDEWFSGIRPEK
jgi:DNA polymerase-1